MNLPLPKETRDYFGGDKNSLLKISNLGLLFSKYFYCWSKDWQTKEEQNKVFRKDIEGITSKPKGSDYIQALTVRQRAVSESLKASNWHVELFSATTDSRLIIGLGGTSVIETGMTLHPLYGFPYLPGSGLKGLARAYAEIAEDFPDEETKKKLLHEIFGSDNKNLREAVEDNRQGKVFFMDGLPTQFPKLDLDIMNPHYGEYYRGEKPPADYLNPVPVTFLAVAAGQPFSFVLFSRDKTLAEKAKAWLIGGLTDLGAGGKTNVGYGYFKIDETTKQPAIKLPAVPIADNSLSARINLIKNPQTFTDCIKSVKEDDNEELRSISFKGMESVINTGLIGVLESVEAPAEVKKIIAQKMLEVCKEPDKKYPDKLQKYKNLIALAKAE